MKKQIQKKNVKKKVSIIIGGSGGQGILTAGMLIALSAIKQKLEVSCFPSYSAAMRGGYVYCTIVICSEQEIFSPISSEIDIGIFMNDESYKMLVSYLKENAFILINSSLIKNCQNKRFRIYEIPATEIAEQLGDIKNANLILAGALGNIINKNFLKFSISSLYTAVLETMSEIEQSKKVIEAGWELIGNDRCQRGD